MPLIRLSLASRVSLACSASRPASRPSIWPDIGTRRGTIEATDGAWVIVRFERMAGTVRVPAEAVEGWVIEQ